MRTDELIAGVLIADFMGLDRFGRGCREQILRGVSIAQELSFTESEQDEAAGNPVAEKSICILNIISSTGEWQTLASWTVTERRIGILSQIEMACDDYEQGRFKLTINDVVLWDGKELPDALTLSFPDVSIRGGKQVLLEGKANDDSAFDMWGDIVGKEKV